MANYQLLKADIDAKVYQNGHQEITGENLNAVLNAMVSTLGAEYQFAGVATKDTNPETTDAKVFYIANGKGTYTNFGGIEVTEDEVVVLYYDTEWHKVSTGIASQTKLTELDGKIGVINGEFSYDVVNSGRIGADGTIVPQETFKYTNPIRLKKGDTIRVKTSGSDIVIIVRTQEDGTFVQWLIVSATNPTPTEFTYTALESIYVVANARFTDEHYVIVESTSEFLKRTDVVNDLTTGGTNVPLSAEMGKKLNEDKANGSEIDEIKNLFTPRISGRIGADGILVPSSNWKHTSPIKLLKGETIQVTTTFATNTTPIVKTDANGNFIQWLVVGDTNDKKTYAYTALESIFVVANAYTPQEYEIKRVQLSLPIIHHITATRNTSNYNSIREIMESITDADKDNQYVIHIPNGEWFECDIVGKKYVTLVGEDREKTILYCDGTSSNLTPSNYGWGSQYANKALNQLDKNFKHCFRPTSDIIAKNMTIRANDCKYCAHIDARTYNHVEFENCHFIANDNVNFPIGTGITSGQHVKFTDCVFTANSWQTCGIFCHNGGNGQQTEPCYLNVENCFFDKCGFLQISELGSNQDDRWSLLNCYSNRGGAIIWFVDSQTDGSTYWINASGEYEKNPQNVPYCINLNALGSNVGGVMCSKWAKSGDYYGLEQRPEIMKHITMNNVVSIPKQSYSVGDVVHGYFDGFVWNPNISANSIGVVVSIVDNLAFVLTQGIAYIDSESITGSPTTTGVMLYDTSRHLNTSGTGNPYAIVSHTYTTAGKIKVGVTIL